MLMLCTAQKESFVFCFLLCNRIFSAIPLKHRGCIFLYECILHLDHLNANLSECVFWLQAHKGVNVESMLAKCLVGTLAPPSPATQRRNSQSIAKSKPE